MTLPGAAKKQFRYAKDGSRLTSPASALLLLETLRAESRAKTLNPIQYLPRKKKTELLFENFAEKYIHARRRDIERPLTPKAERSIRTSLTQYLAPTEETLAARPQENGAPVGHAGFRGVSIEEITTGMVKRFQATWCPARMVPNEAGELVPVAKTTRSRDVALEVLHAILSYAFELEYLQVMPRFGDRKRSSESTERVPFEVQEGVLSRIEDPWRAAMEAMRILLCRHSDIRALRNRDLDRERGGVWIRQHYSGNVLRPGRKSDSTEHYVPVGPDFFEILERLSVRSLGPDALVFSPDGVTPLPENSFNSRWRAALASYNSAHGTEWDVDSYRGIKSSTWSYSEDAGVDRQKLARRAGVATGMGKHYGSRSTEATRGAVEGVILKLKRPETAKEAT